MARDDASILPAVNIYINIILILYSLASSTFNLLASRSATNTFSTPLDTSRHSRYAKIEFLLVFLYRVFPHRSRKSLFKITKIYFLFGDTLFEGRVYFVYILSRFTFPDKAADPNEYNAPSNTDAYFNKH